MAATQRIATLRITAAVAAAAACAAALAGCANSDTGARTDRRTEGGAEGPKKAAPAAPGSAVRLIGDGSTAYTGRQPHLPRAERLRPGQKPPQFVVFSWDGAGEDSQRLFSHFRKVAEKNNATMTYFLSGVYLLPGAKKDLYHPPQHSPGRSDIGFNDAEGIRDTVEQLRGAWLEGNEIGTHFNGHFCGSGGGVGQWSVSDWKSEIQQAKSFVKAWKTNTGLKKADPLPFDYEKELVGARTPCLEGQKNFMRAAHDLGFRYDTSGVNNQLWPKKKDGLWDLSMQLVPFRGHSYEQLTMDYNFMVNQSGTVHGDPGKRQYWGDQMRDSLVAGFDRAYKGNRAPLIIGNHFESWNGGVYMRAVEQTVETVCNKPEVRCVSFRQLADWLDAQDPKTLEKLTGLEVGKAPEHGWDTFLADKPAPAPKKDASAPATTS
ncbi:hypothetical protein OKJ48_25415 [Streptomyces kunmingensis]|uniref:Lipoprotein n=1 Tax=Streptomyces kunmingensis TaxID=68225 RepID=A0ABU6CFR6_9ACTN|nr:hypothetical protein [Streptomyces kunmingensis]MEB3963553.1 hypothetical protein [Streptomyces kunmingensis]